MHTSIQKPTAQSIRSNVNEKKFFKSMKHLFSTSFSVLAELMQNSRRAGATQIAFDFDPVKKSLSVTDNGKGIVNFADLVSLCDSGWDESVVLTDKPFGMGFFSLFFACEQVIVRSRGLKLVATLDDIVNKRMLTAESDLIAVEQGTVIQLNGLSEDLLARKYPHSQQSLELTLPSRVAEYARGFPIQVIFNGEELERPHALHNLNVTHTQYGQISLAHVHDARSADHLIGSETNLPCSDTAFYLQGLPIKYKNDPEARIIVHLDGQKFTPRMPDRSDLYEGRDQIDALKTEINRLIINFLVEKKAELTPIEFASQYWDTCGMSGARYLLNDVPLIPKKILFNVGNIERGFSLCERPSKYSAAFEAGFLSREEISSGMVTIWRDVPSDVFGHQSDCAILKTMQRCGIKGVNTDSFDTSHWIFEIAPSCSDFDVQIHPSDVIASDKTWVSDCSVDIKLVDVVNIEITSDTDATFKFVHELQDDWVCETADDGNHSYDVVCYVTKSIDLAPDHPVTALENFMDDERHDESAQDDAIAQWNQIVAGLLGCTLESLLKDSLNSPVLQAQHLGQLVLVTAQQEWLKDEDRFSYPSLSTFDIEKPEVWEQFAELLKQKGNFDANDLKSLFVSVTGAIGKVGEPQNIAE